MNYFILPVLNLNDVDNFELSTSYMLSVDK